jgi:hypothetical protein
MGVCRSRDLSPRRAGSCGHPAAGLAGGDHPGYPPVRHGCGVHTRRMGWGPAPGLCGALFCVDPSQARRLILAVLAHHPRHDGGGGRGTTVPRAHLPWGRSRDRCLKLSQHHHVALRPDAGVSGAVERRALFQPQRPVRVGGPGPGGLRREPHVLVSPADRSSHCPHTWPWSVAGASGGNSSLGVETLTHGHGCLGGRHPSGGTRRALAGVAAESVELHRPAALLVGYGNEPDLLGQGHRLVPLLLLGLRSSHGGHEASRRPRPQRPLGDLA